MIWMSSGRLCEEERDDCVDQPCGLGATCIDGISKYVEGSTLKGESVWENTEGEVHLDKDIRIRGNGTHPPRSFFEPIFCCNMQHC